MRELCVDLGLTQRLPSHLEEPNEIIGLPGATCNLDNLGEIRRVFSLDVGVYGIR